MPLFDGLTLIHANSDVQISEQFVGDAFIIQTCQRSLVLGHGLSPKKYVPLNCEAQIFHETDAYRFLLRTITGLESKIAGENEIVAQFKEAFESFLKLNDKNPHLVMLLEKLFKDAKKVRSQFLTELNSLTYSGIARKIVSGKCSTKRVLITGSGKLAEDTIKIMYKKFDLYISARNRDRVHELVNLYGVRPIEWQDYKNFLNFSALINTIGSQDTLFDNDFLSKWDAQHDVSNRVIVDLASPSPFANQEHIHGLNQIFKEEEILSKEKKEKIHLAAIAIDETVQKRRESLALTYPFSWEELSFA